MRQKSKRDRIKEQRKALSPEARALAIERLGLRSKGPHAFIDGIDSYALAYAQVVGQCRRDHPSLLGVFECSDAEFYDYPPEKLLARFKLDDFRRVLFTTIDSIDFGKDESTSQAGIVNDNHPRKQGAITGHTTILERMGKQRSAIFMRRSTDTSIVKKPEDNVDPADVVAATKLTALAHELGHVDDFEKAINYKNDTIALVEAEVYAHSHACNFLLNGNYVLALSFYLQGLEEMAGSNSEYVTIAASRVTQSPEYQEFTHAVASFHEGVKNLNPA